MGEQKDVIADLLPLREPTFFILLSLSSGEKHGYAIMKDVEELSQGALRLSTGTLYEALARLLEQALIERVSPAEAEVENPPGGQNHPGRPRKAYRLALRGQQVLEAETARMRALVAAAQRRLGGEAS
jgi:DNA-binding PadR family transcriptional regulator